MIPILWSLKTTDGSMVQWSPGSFDKLPSTCICGGSLTVTLLEQDGTPGEMTCGGGHLWQSTLNVIERRLREIQREHAAEDVKQDLKEPSTKT